MIRNDNSRDNISLTELGHKSYKLISRRVKVTDEGDTVNKIRIYYYCPIIDWKMKY